MKNVESLQFVSQTKNAFEGEQSFLIPQYLSKIEEHAPKSMIAMIDQIEVIPTHRGSIVIIIIEIQSWEMHAQTIFQLVITKTYAQCHWETHSL